MIYQYIPSSRITALAHTTNRVGVGVAQLNNLTVSSVHGHKPRPRLRLQLLHCKITRSVLVLGGGISDWPRT